MSQEEDILKNLRQIIKEQGIDSFHLLEDLVPIEDQMDYFRHYDKVRVENASFDRDEEIVILFSSNQPLERKKKSLLRLASIPDVRAYRAIETYHSSPAEPELTNWSSMSLLGSRILLSSNLSGQQQIYISSGLGGADKRLRFFGLFATKNRAELTELQREIVEREFIFYFEKAGISIEKFEIKDNYFTILMLFPIDSDARRVISEALEEINKYGDFLNSKYLFTNVRILSDEQIEKMLAKEI